MILGTGAVLVFLDLGVLRLSRRLAEKFPLGVATCVDRQRCWRRTGLAAL